MEEGKVGIIGGFGNPAGAIWELALKTPPLFLDTGCAASGRAFQVH